VPGEGEFSGEPVALDVPAQIRDGRTLVPLRFVAEALGAAVAWDGATRSITITAPGTSLPVDMESGLLAFGLYTAEPDDTQSHLEWATIDQAGRNLTKRFSLSRYDTDLRLSPDGTRLAAFGVEPDYSLSYQVYDLAAGTATQLNLPPFSDIKRVVCWSPDSKFISYVGQTPETEYRLARVPVDGTAGSYVDSASAEAMATGIAAIPGKDRLHRYSRPGRERPLPSGHRRLLRRGSGLTAPPSSSPSTLSATSQEPRISSGAIPPPATSRPSSPARTTRAYEA